MRLDIHTRYSLTKDWIPIWMGRIFILLLLVFPKGGVQVSDLPVTWSYIWIGLSSLFFLPTFVYRFLSDKIGLKIYTFVFLLGLFFLWSTGCVLLNGFATSIGYLVSFVISAIILPVYFLVWLPRPASPLFYRTFVNDFRHALLFVCVVGLGLFVYKLATGSYAGIPYLTYTSGDISVLDEKMNSRGNGISKLFSTYNNGNLYGISMLILLPLFEAVENNLFKKMLLKASIILTLSRTAWAGLIFYETVRFLFFQRITLKRLLFFISGLVTCAAGIWAAAQYMEWDFDTIFDRALGGRTTYLGEISLLPNIPFIGIGEITYVYILYDFGVAGLILFLAFYFAPSVFLGKVRTRLGKLRNRALFGIVMYWFLSCSDGAFLYVPVPAIYWFLNWVLFNPRFDLEKYETVEPKPPEIPKLQQPDGSVPAV